MKFFDSTFLVDYLRGESAVGTYLEANADEEFVTSTINFKEVAVGELTVDDPTRREVLSDFGWLRVESFGPRHAYAAAEIEATLRESGRYDSSLAGDVLVGGAAKALDTPVVTRNVADFERFDGVDVERY